MSDRAEWTIRPAVRSRTLQRLRELIRQGGQVSGRPFLDGRYFVLVTGDRIAGCVGLRRTSAVLSEIRHLVVLPEFRRRGLARALVEHAIGLAETPVLFASVRLTNQASRAVFGRVGFQPALSYGGDRERDPEHRIELWLRPAPPPPVSSRKGGPHEDSRTAQDGDPEPHGEDRPPQAAA